MLPTILADWNNINPDGRVRFTNGTFADIERLNIKLAPGLKVILDDGEGLAVEGEIEFSATENIWVGKFDKEKLHNILPNK
ncbi:MAG: hypothetical protein ABUT20_26150 [Bacteroidota bacterium]